MVSPHPTLAALIDTFDWNVSRFGFDGKAVVQEMSIADIAPGKDLKLHRVTNAPSTLRRGFRFSERFAMNIPNVDLHRLCALIVRDPVDSALKAGVSAPHECLRPPHRFGQFLHSISSLSYGLTKRLTT